VFRNFCSQTGRNIAYGLLINQKKFVTPPKFPPSWFSCEILQFFSIIIKNIIFVAKIALYKNIGDNIFNKYDSIRFSGS